MNFVPFATITVKIYDLPKTPFQRVLDSPFAKPGKKKEVQKLFETLNPFELQKTMKQKITQLIKIASIE